MGGGGGGGGGGGQERRVFQTEIEGKGGELLVGTDIGEDRGGV